MWAVSPSISLASTVGSVASPQITRCPPHVENIAELGDRDRLLGYVVGAVGRVGRLLLHVDAEGFVGVDVEAGALEVWQVVEQRLQFGGVVVGEVVGAVVGEDDARCTVVVDVDEGRGDVFPAELLRGLDRVVAGENFVGAGADDDGFVLAVAFEAFGDRGDGAAAWVLPVVVQLVDSDDE